MTSCNIPCASLDKFDSTDKAHDLELSFIADCVNVCSYIALHCLALTALPWTYCIALHLLHCRQAHVMQTLHCFASNFADKHMSCILYDVTVNTCMGLQATQRRLACREVAQLINCAVDDLLGDRRSGHDPDPEDNYPRDPPSGSAEGHKGPGNHGGASGDHGRAFGDREAGSGNSNSTNSDSAPSGDQASGSGDWRGGAGGYDGVILRLEMPQAEPFEYQQGSQDAYSDCTDCESDSEIPPWAEDSPLLSDSGPQLSVREQKWAAELHAQNDET